MWGETPILDTPVTKEVKPLNPKVYQHHDSKKAYKVIKGLKERESLKEKYYDYDSNYGQFLTKHPNLNWTLLQNQYQEFLKNTNQSPFHFLFNYSVIINNLVQQNQVKLEETISFLISCHPISYSIIKLW